MTVSKKANHKPEDRKVNCPVHGKQRAEDRSGQCEPCIYGRNIEPTAIKNHAKKQ